MVAHGVLLAAEMNDMIATLKQAGLCKDVHYKELYIRPSELESGFQCRYLVLFCPSCYQAT